MHSCRYTSIRSSIHGSLAPYLFHLCLLSAALLGHSVLTPGLGALRHSTVVPGMVAHQTLCRSAFCSLRAVVVSSFVPYAYSFRLSFNFPCTCTFPLPSAARPPRSNHRHLTAASLCALFYRAFTLNLRYSTAVLTSTWPLPSFVSVACQLLVWASFFGAFVVAFTRSAFLPLP